jgi:hypothetical protein
MSCAKLGPTEPDEIGKMVDLAVTLVFGGAMPNRRAGADASNAVRRSKRDERAAAAPTANDVISRTINSAMEGDGTASASAALAPFPSRLFGSH